MKREVTIEEYADAICEVEKFTPTILISMRPIDSVALVGALQLAMRHPEFTGPTRDICLKVIDTVRRQIDHKTVTRVIEMGFDEHFDQ